MPNDEAVSWRELYLFAIQEKDRTRKLQLCAQARRVIQHRLLVMALPGSGNYVEERSLEAALRRLWVAENR